MTRVISGSNPDRATNFGDKMFNQYSLKDFDKPRNVLVWMGERLFGRWYRYSWLYKVRWYITHWWRKDHWIKTNLPIGYHDKPQLIEDGLFSLVEDFVSRNGEDAFCRIYIDDWVYKTIIDILYWYRIRRPEMESKKNMLMNMLYGDRTKMWWEDCKDKEGYCELKVDEEFYQRMEPYTLQLRKLEKEIHLQTQTYLHKVIGIRGYLWT